MRPAALTQRDAGPRVRGWCARGLADEFYGGHRGLRRDLQARGMGYVLAVARSHRVSVPVGVLRADQVAAGLSKRAWNRYSCGDGSKARRDYDWGATRRCTRRVSSLIGGSMRMA